MCSGVITHVITHAGHRTRVRSVLSVITLTYMSLMSRTKANTRKQKIEGNHHKELKHWSHRDTTHITHSWN